MKTWQESEFETVPAAYIVAASHPLTRALCTQKHPLFCHMQRLQGAAK